MRKILNGIVAICLVTAMVTNTAFVSMAAEEVPEQVQSNMWVGTVENGDRSYLNESGEKLTGLHEIEEKMYCFSEEGILLTGWQNVDGETYYFSLTTGERYENREESIEGKVYVFDAFGKSQEKIEEKQEEQSDNEEQKQEAQKNLENADENLSVASEETETNVPTEVQTGWVEKDGKKCYIMPDGSLRVGWLSFGNTYYYCGSDGAIVIGFQTIDGKRYYFDEEGVRQTGWIEKDGKKYYGMPDGSLRVGWLSFGNTYYYCGSDGVIVTGFQTIDGKRYYFDEEGVRQTGWIEKDGKKYYGMPDGSLRVGWLSFGEIVYYCGNDGAIVTDQPYTVSGVCYYFNEKGVRTSAPSGWQVINGKKYYGMPDGTFRVGWLSFGKTYYYCGSDGSVITNQPYTVNGVSYYFDEEGVRRSAPSGWQVINGKKYYGMPDGTFRVGWLSFGKTYYYCGSDGAIVTGLQSIGGKKYYFNEDGIRQTGWIEEGGKKYYGMPDGSLRVGWLSFGKTYYCCGSDGAIVTGLQTVDGKRYYFNEDGIRQTGWIEEGGKKYYGMPDGSFRVGWLSFGKTYYYCGNDGAVIASQSYAVNGVLYTFDENGVMQKESGWGEYNGNKYYKNPETGFPYANQWVTFGTTYYYANSNGHMVSGWQKIGNKFYYFYPDTKIMARNTTIDGFRVGADGARVSTVLSNMTARIWSYSSSTQYLLAVDCNAHKVGVFKGSQGNWSNIHFWDCANGAPSTPTKKGVFTIGIRGYYFDSGSSRCFWYTQFSGNYLFHTILCNKDGSIRDGRVGMALSHGCVRLQIPNAKWIYDNIPKGTKVVVY
ncbi:L,D-transpeptidase family protein [Faecalicatena contorta]|uniref:L,D-transpeptidase family protein n=1 Tax=Faecalicatena contorta TaxID=39482 RepID=UPI001EEEBA6E|nr:L,D-transpeptidase family protein [Faecalicatena contorta]MCF2681359.1 L,D-transpeptidase family protein [Faecalicatena contorta]